MPGASSSIAGYLYHNYEGESFYKGREKETRDIHKWRRTISEKKPEFDPKVPNWLLVYVSISPIESFQHPQ